MDKRKKNLIVTLADANFIDQAKQLFSSVYHNAGWEGDYLLLAYNIPENELAWFIEKGIVVYRCEPLSDPLLRIGKTSYPPVVLSKFYLFKEYFKQWSKIIFLDADIIVRASLYELLALKGFNAPHALTFTLKDEFAEAKKLSSDFRKKYDMGRPALNTGIMAFDTSLIESGTFAKIKDLHDSLAGINEYNEESTLNIFFYDKWNMLPVTYNSAPWYMDCFYKIKEADIRAYILHFVCSENKPWEKESSYHQEWVDNLKKAEHIDLNKVMPAKRIGSRREIESYYRYLRKREMTNSLKAIFLRVDEEIGKIGLFIKKKNPALYKLISLQKDDRK